MVHSSPSLHQAGTLGRPPLLAGQHSVRAGGRRPRKTVDFPHLATNCPDWRPDTPRSAADAPGVCRGTIDECPRPALFSAETRKSPPYSPLFLRKRCMLLQCSRRPLNVWNGFRGVGLPAAVRILPENADLHNWAERRSRASSPAPIADRREAGSDVVGLPRDPVHLRI